MAQDVQPDTNDQRDELKQYEGPEGLWLRWHKELNLVLQSKAQRAYEQIGDRIVKKYRNAAALNPSAAFEAQVPNRTMFNVLWSNIQVLKPSLYSRMPKVVVERRFKDTDPVGRLASQIAERATSFMLSTQQDRFNYAIKAAVEDRLLPGRGQVWLRYTAEFDEETTEEGEPVLDEAGEAIKQVKPNSEKVLVDPVNWLDYLESLARNQYEVRWRARKIYKTRQELLSDPQIPRDIAKKVELTYKPGNSRKKFDDDDADFLMQAEIWVIADLTTKQIIWHCEGYKESPLKVEKDPLRLDDFFPCPIPLLATTTTDSTHPTPDFIIYEKLADELDFITKRISSMVECVRLVGATASQYSKDIKNMLALGDGQLWPIDNWPSFVEKGGWKGVIDWLPFDSVVAAIPVLMTQQQNLLGQIFEITGIPDIARGLTDPNETLGAQDKKLRSMGTKAEEKSRDVQRFCRETISKMAEIIFEPGLFSDETIALMSGLQQMELDDQENFPMSLQLLRDDRLRTFRVDIETDSTIAMDEQSEQASRMEYIGALTELLSGLQNVMQFRPELIHPMIESIKWATASFRTGRSVEGSWSKALDEIESNDENAQAEPPPPDYEQQKIEQKYQEMQMDFEIASKDLEIKGMKVMSDQQIEQMDQELKTFAEQFKQHLGAKQLELDTMRVALEEREKMIEEERLAREDEEGTRRGGKNGGQPVNVNVHTDLPVNMTHVERPKRKKTVTVMKRLPDGQLVGESDTIEEHLPNEEDIAAAIVKGATR